MQLYNFTVANRLLLGTALYPSLEIMQKSILAAKSSVVTVSLRRQIGSNKQPNYFWDIIKQSSCRILPNTAGCFNAKEAIYTAQMAREIFETNWLKLEVVGDEQTLHPHPYELIKACEHLVALGFEIFPYCTEDLIVCEHLVSLGCEVLMPWGAPIGTGKGLLNTNALKLLRDRFPDKTLIVDAGIGAPSHAAYAMELGFDGVLVNSAVALADNPIQMAQAFSAAINAGRLAFESGLMPTREFATTSTSLINKPFQVV